MIKSFASALLIGLAVASPCWGGSPVTIQYKSTVGGTWSTSPPSGSSYSSSGSSNPHTVVINSTVSGYWRVVCDDPADDITSITVNSANTIDVTLIVGKDSANPTNEVDPDVELLNVGCDNINIIEKQTGQPITLRVKAKIDGDFGSTGRQPASARWRSCVSTSPVTSSFRTSCIRAPLIR
jgi:hypothetical protein